MHVLIKPIKWSFRLGIFSFGAAFQWTGTDLEIVEDAERRHGGRVGVQQSPQHVLDLDLNRATGLLLLWLLLLRLQRPASEAARP